jgi:hypothetical protein
MHLRHNNTEQAYFMEGQQLEVTKVERDIRVNVVKGLKQASQCQKAARMAQGVLSHISRAFHYRDRNVFLRTICEAAPAVCESGMVPMAGGRQGSVGESAKKSSEHDIWAKSKNL